MKKNDTDSVQNRFSAYLVAAVSNQRIRYFTKRNRLMEWEQGYADMLEKNYTDFGEQLRRYQCEQSAEFLESLADRIGEEQMQRVLSLLEGERLIRLIGRLKEHERRILFARVFGELTFEEIGMKSGMKPKQAEMAYYYIIRKLRKGMGVRKDEF